MSKEIALTGKRGEGLFAIVDDSDFEPLRQFKWNLQGGNYARRNVRLVDGSRSSTSMHQQIIGDIGQGLEIDHIDGNGLNNTRLNLRVCSHQQNIFNSRKRLSSSGYRGVFKRKRDVRWYAVVSHSGKKHHLGWSSSPLEAAIAYNQKASDLFGNYAVLNNVDYSECINEFDPIAHWNNNCQRRGNKSGYRGVGFHTKTSKWTSAISCEGSRLFLGLFDDKEEAAYIYDQFALQLHGNRALLNILY